jgi:hypothetical protein
MKDSTNLPDLRVFPVHLLVPHEDCDPRRIESLCRRLLEEQRLKNPPIVAPIPETERYVILDGANRVLAFQAMNIPHIVAQLVDYNNSGVVLDTWYHVVTDMNLDEFESALACSLGLCLEDCSLEEARQALANREIVAYIVCESGVRKVCNPRENMQLDIHFLNQLVNVYRGKANIFRASNDIWEKQAPYYPGITAIVIFPRYTPEDILLVARNGDKIPTGITRHIIPYRAVNINIPLSVLAADWSLEQKQAWLHDWLMERMAANAIRYYAESTFTFDE